MAAFPYTQRRAALCAATQEAALTGDFDTAEQILTRLLPLMDALFRKPATTGEICQRLGHGTHGVLLPAVPKRAPRRMPPWMIDLAMSSKALAVAKNTAGDGTDNRRARRDYEIADKVGLVLKGTEVKVCAAAPSIPPVL